MVPFCGYHMGDYFAHWLATGAAGDASRLPRIFQVNWFRKDADGNFLWPGFGENSRVLAWIAERCEGTAEALETPIGLLPAPGALPVENLELSDAALETLLAVDVAGWTAELPGMAAYLAGFGDRLPPELLAQLDDLRSRLETAS
jgi:phosphoenolpyruvate carboxykinase (GTP)